MSLPETLAALMFLSACIGLMAGYNVAFTLAGVSALFAAIATALGLFDPTFFLSLPARIYPLITREILIAVPLFVFMGVMLEKSRIAEELLQNMGDLFGPLRGGLGISVIFVGALLAASTGIVGATVVTMGLLSLPTMLKRGYDIPLASASIAASGTLGQIIPPSIVLVILGDQIGNAFQEAQRSYGLETDAVVSVGDLFAGALVPGLILVGAYALYIFITAVLTPSKAPAQPWPDDSNVKALLWRSAKAMIPPIFLIIAVLGSILSGYATPTRGAALGALGAMLLAATRLAPNGRRWPLYGALALLALVALDLTGLDLRIAQTKWTGIELGGGILAAALVILGIVGTLIASLRLLRNGQLADVSRSTMHITGMVFVILIGATVFSLVFRGLGGDEMVARLMEAAPGGTWGAFALVMLVMFVLGFFLDFIEITFVVVPLVAPPLLAAGLDPVWLGVVMALNLQTSFLTPPFGFALFYLRGVSPPEVTTAHLYRGVIPFIGIQLALIALLIAFPGLVTGILD
ncbi:C4-dicarboxylate ABC transporter [Algimonas porphyrae]|uniref:C4-dicarboxylate ABC transporter n=2 Tax=Algimonas porphyrae TaxID=1128113 RepID=A0ABQ5UXQ2_9PROT|nr:TRAP transporter large permease subunit [Algimonas porphyrae]GLQ19145.1 C4-dicarboxylate ABC transporter [Algimonas porphyrae]